MNPELIKKLLESEVTKELVGFLANEADKLDRLSDIKLTTKEEIAIEVLGRKRAHEKILAMLEPLLNSNTSTGAGVTNKEFVV